MDLSVSLVSPLASVVEMDSSFYYNFYQHFIYIYTILFYYLNNVFIKIFILLEIFFIQ